MCINHPWEFGVYLRYCRNLRFSQTPDYNYLKSLFRGCLKRNEYPEDYKFDWSIFRAKSRISLYSVSNSPSNIKNIEEGRKTPNVGQITPRSGRNVNNDENEAAGKLLNVARPYRGRRFSRSLPNSLGNSLEEKNKSETSKENGSLSVVEASPIMTPETLKKMTKLTNPQRESSADSKRSANATHPIPILKISPVSKSSQGSAKKVSATSRNQLFVPNGTPKNKNRKSSTPPNSAGSVSKQTAISENVPKLGSATVMIRNGVNVAEENVSKNANIVTCSTCFPLFQRFAVRQS